MLSELERRVLAELGVDLLGEVVELAGDLLDLEVRDALGQPFLGGSAWRKAYFSAP